MLRRWSRSRVYVLILKTIPSSRECLKYKIVSFALHLSNMDWRYSDPSDDEGNHEAPTSNRKRSSRACDQCRKSKSKCERPNGDVAPCKSCSLTGAACTFLGPSHKRGPPKGYIHAIEQRWHQVEALLGAIIQCSDPRVQTLVSDLRQDDLAREIIHRVDMGPYGPSGRRSQPEGATKEDFFASILKSSATGDSTRSRRQSRVSREIVSSSQDHGLSVVPTKEWQDQLSKHLAASSQACDTEARITRRRRLNLMAGDSPPQPDWKDMYTLEAEEEDQCKGAAEALGELSLDEHREIRFHGKASGLHLLGRSVRTDDRHEGGIWKLPMARIWPASQGCHDLPPQDPVVPLPPIHVQDLLLDLYFTYVHPAFPVIHKCRFLAEYNSRKRHSHTGLSPEANTPRPEASQEVTPLLLFSIFAIAARFCEDGTPPPPRGEMWGAGCDYLNSARTILSRILHQSRPSTVQSLLLLGHREFGIGSMEQGWIFIGMAVRMAMDLGLNCDSSSWKIHGRDLFLPEENQHRRQIWWACCLADRYGAVYMGRPVLIKDEDFDTPLPAVDLEEDNIPWPPPSSNNFDVSYPSAPGRITSNFRALASLSMICGAIITKLYPVRPTPNVSRRSLSADLEARLDQWFIRLPEELRYETTSRRQVPPPHILFLHIRYWGTVLILNRAFIPNWKGAEFTSRNTFELKAFDLAQGAAGHISAIVTTYCEHFTLKRSSPFLTSFILAAAVMHVLTLTLRPSNVQASVGFQQCMAALKDMEMVWPSASRAWDLLNGVKMDDILSPQLQDPARYKRQADDAFGHEKGGPQEVLKNAQAHNEAENGPQALGTRIMAQMFGFHVPGVEPSTSFLPGYEWWPRSDGDSRSTTHNPLGSRINHVSSPPNRGINETVHEWTQVRAPDMNYSFDFGRF